MNFLKISVSLFALFGVCGAGIGQDRGAVGEGDLAHLWLREPAVSPDGSAISFSYRGQIYYVDTNGGMARPVTSQGYQSKRAVWSPDSKKLALSTNVNGDFDVYLTDFSGNLERYTWSSRNEVPVSFSPNGKDVLFTAIRLGDAEASVQASLSGLPQLYAFDVESGRETLVLPNLAEEAIWNEAHDKLLYSVNRSADPKARQHRVAANARQIWIYDSVTGEHKRPFQIDADTHNPVWAENETQILYISEASGRKNIWRYTLATDTHEQITHYDKRPVDALSVSNAGDIVFANDGILYKIIAGSAQPKAIEVIIPEQVIEQPERMNTSISTEFVVSPKGDISAAIVNADVYLLDSLGNYRQATETASEERYLTFSPDGTKLFYAAQRDHEWGIYAIDLQEEISNGEGLSADYIELPVLVEAGNNYQLPKLSPNGEKLAVIANRREVMVLDIASNELTKIFKETDYNTSYSDGDLGFEWSPNSENLIVDWRAVPGSAVGLIGVVAANGEGSIVPLADGIARGFGALWSRDGTQILGFTDKYGLKMSDNNSIGAADIFQVFLSEDSRRAYLDIYDDKLPADHQRAKSPSEEKDSKEADDVEFVPLTYALDKERSERLSKRLSAETQVYFNMMLLPDMRSAITTNWVEAGQFEINRMDLRSGEETLIATLPIEQAYSVQYIDVTNSVYVQTDLGIIKLDLSNPEQLETFPLDINYAIAPSEVRSAAFEQVWADVKATYYRSDIESRDWDEIGDRYRAFLGSIASGQELGELVEAMLGELSASHLFSGYVKPKIRETLVSATGSLGVYLDYGYEGEGRRVAAILPGGAVDRNGIDINVGDILVSINGKPVPEMGGIDRLLDGVSGKQVSIGVKSSGAGDVHWELVTPISQDEEAVLQQLRGIDMRRALVNRLSNGCVVYQYLPAMDNENYINVYGRFIASKYTTQAAIFDIRSNVGGNLHAQLLELVSGKPFGFVGREERVLEPVPSNRYQKPSAVVVDSYSYSDGSIFPQAFQDMKLGPVIGDYVVGTGTALNTIHSRILDGFFYSIPVLPYRRLDQSYYENNIITPDVYVAFDPNKAGINVDPQLEAAVASMMLEIGETTQCVYN